MIVVMLTHADAYADDHAYAYACTHAYVCYVKKIVVITKMCLK